MATTYTVKEIARALEGVGVSAQPSADLTEVHIYGLGFTEGQGLIAKFELQDYDDDSNGARGAAYRILQDLAEYYLLNVA